MLGNKDAVANVAVKDLNVAADFYRNTLGLKPVHEEGKELVVFASGHSSINVYRSDYAGTNKATAVTWTVDNVEDEVKASVGITALLTGEHHHEAVRTLDGRLPKEKTLHEGKDSRIRADAECHRDHHEHRKCRRFPTDAQRIPDVLRERLETRPAPQIAAALALQRDIAKTSGRHPVCLLSRQALLAQARRTEFEMMRHLVGEFLLVTIPAQPHPQGPPLFAKPRH